MAVTGKTLIGPATESAGVVHHMEDIVVDVPSGQDGIWSAPAYGARARDLHVAGGNGTNSFGIRIGATSDDASYRGIYHGLSVLGSQNGIELFNANHVQVFGADVQASQRHGLFINDCDDCQVVGITIDTPSFLNSGVYDAIRIGGLSYRNRVSEILMPDDGTAYHQYAVNCTNSHENMIGEGSLAEGTDGWFSQSTYYDNDFGLELTTYSLATVIDTTGSGLLLLPFVVDATVYAIELRLRTAATGSSVIVDVNKNDTTIFPTTTKPTLATTATSSVAYPDTTYIAAGQAFTVDIDQADSNGVAEGLTVNVLWRRI